MKMMILPFVLWFAINSYCQISDKEFIDEVHEGLTELTILHSSIKDIHTFLNDLQPVAVIKGDELFIFDNDSLKGGYIFIKKINSPFPMSEGIRASFPLMDYGNRPVCVTGKDAFSTTGGQAVILHEFVHCAQYNSIELELKGKLELYKTAIEKKNYSWEIDHPFPFDSLFLKNYKAFHNSLQSGNKLDAEKFRQKIKEMLSNIDFEYMVWQEWKEGFARYLENQIRKKSGAKENTGGMDYPEDRVVFYFGGSSFIKYLISNNNELMTNLRLLFDKMLLFPGELKLKYR